MLHLGVGSTTINELRHEGMPVFVLRRGTPFKRRGCRGLVTRDFVKYDLAAVNGWLEGRQTCQLIDPKRHRSPELAKTA